MDNIGNSNTNNGVVQADGNDQNQHSSSNTTTADGTKNEQKDNSDTTNRKVSKRRRKKRKRPVIVRRTPLPQQQQQPQDNRAAANVSIEYISGVDQLLADDDPRMAEMRQIMERFTAPVEAKEEDGSARREHEDDHDGLSSDEDDMRDSDEDDGDDNDDDEHLNLSKKKLRKLRQMDVSELKQTAKRPDVVELHDVTAQDPKLLVYLKSLRNTVPVPPHWNLKRRYLQYKRGVEKPPFKLPEFIERTGIQTIREAYLEREAKKSSKQKMRKWARPSMGKMDVDYAILHDAFFKHQTKPKLTILGDVYYEGKENEVRMSHLKPGFISNTLRQALGMPDNGADPTVPPPWLINLQRYGPPPSYPTLKIPGLNTQIPEGAQWGFKPGCWGRPPMDEFGNPLYGNVYSNEDGEGDEYAKYEAEIERQHWGEPISVHDDEDEEEEEEEEEEEDEEEEETEDVVDRATLESGIASVASSTGYATPDVVRLRKTGSLPPPPPPPPPSSSAATHHPQQRELFQVLEQKQMPGALAGSRNIMGSSYRYVMPTANTVEATFDPSELAALEKDPSLLKDKFDVLQREKQGGSAYDDDDKPKKKFKF